MPFPFARTLALLVFGLAALTDAFDGHLARSRYVVTPVQRADGSAGGQGTRVRGVCRDGENPRAARPRVPRNSLMACVRRCPVKAQNSSSMRPLPHRPIRSYRPFIRSTNSRFVG